MTNTGYTCRQDPTSGVNCAGAWQLTSAVTYQLPAGSTFTSTGPGCTTTGPRLACTWSTPAGNVLLFNSPVLPACPPTTTTTDSAPVPAAASTPACYHLPPNGALPVLWERNLLEIRDSHFPGGKKVDKSKSLFHPDITNNKLQEILEAGLKDQCRDL